MQRFTLIKTASMWLGEGEKLKYDHPVGYEVGGMPVGRGAYIYMSEHASDRWQILPITNDVSEERYGDFESADDALASLQADVNREQTK